MKERFRKKILPVIHISFRKVLTKESLDNFEKYAKGLKVDTPPSTQNSEDESIEREMNQALAQSTPITSSEKYITQEQFQRLQGMPLMSDFYLK